MTDEQKTTLEKSFQKELVKWSVVMLGGLVVAGAVSLANRDVYSKEQVDVKMDDQETARAYEIRIINTKLDNLSQDVAEIKEEVKKQ